MNARRGNESIHHLEAKMAIGRLFNDPDWAVLYEQRNADVLVMHIATRFLAAIEVESSPKNVSRNLERDTTNGCGVVAVVALNGCHLPRITAKAVEHAMIHPGTGVMVFPHDTRGLKSLSGWLAAVARSKQNHKGHQP